ncbi:MAG: hypothetical protein ACLRR3_04545 [Eubacterium sp.]
MPMIIYAFVFCILLGIGLNTRLSYKDFNDEKEPLDNFVVGLMDKKNGRVRNRDDVRKSR